MKSPPALYQSTQVEKKKILTYTSAELVLL